MKRFDVPMKNEVSENNQAIFTNLEKGLGFVPNLYAYYAKSNTALQDYLNLQNRKSSLSKKEQEVVNLVVSQINGCEYCLSAHTVLGGMNGFTPEQILDIRSREIGFNDKLAALANVTSEIVNRKGNISDTTKSVFFEAGYGEEHLIDLVIQVGDKTISNYIHNIAQFDIDFPLAPSLAQATV